MLGKGSGSIHSEVSLFPQLTLTQYLNFLAELPIDKSMGIQEINKRRLYAKTKTFSIFRRMFFSIVYKFEMEYWVLHCGCDGYLYLLF